MRERAKERDIKTIKKTVSKYGEKRERLERERERETEAESLQTREQHKRESREKRGRQ